MLGFFSSAFFKAETGKPGANGDAGPKNRGQTGTPSPRFPDNCFFKNVGSASLSIPGFVVLFLVLL